MKKITCDDAVLTADAAPILKAVSTETVESVSKSEYESSYTSTLPKCPVEKFGILEAAGEDDPESSLYGGLISISTGGEITFDGEAMLAGEDTSYSFQIVGVTGVGKRAFK
jgi:FKBP-type peptidyl-prolyl cis-trans isomerase 2